MNGPPWQRPIRRSILPNYPDEWYWFWRGGTAVAAVWIALLLASVALGAFR